MQDPLDAKKIKRGLKEAREMCIVSKVKQVTASSPAKEEDNLSWKYSLHLMM